MPCVLEVESKNATGVARVSYHQGLFSRHVEPGYSLWFTLSGKERYVIMGKTYLMRPGKVLVVEPNSLIVRKAEDEIRVQEMSIHLSRSFFSKVGHEHDRSLAASMISRSEGLLIPGIMRASGSIHPQHILKQLLEQGNPDEVFNDVAKWLLKSRGAYPQPERGEDPWMLAEKLRRLSKARAYLHKNYDQPLALSELASQACLSVYYFSHLFKRFFKLSPIHYLKELRMKHALILLHEGGCSVAEVAVRVGFIDLPTFSKAFKRRFGMPPSRVSRLEGFMNGRA